jgi:ABC-type uncharacterized transport system auxiliary subunit
MKYIRILLFLTTIILFAGCSTKSLPPITKYTIDESIDVDILPVKVGNCKSIKIGFPQSSDEIFSKNIIYQKGLQKNGYYFSKWFETPNEMLYKLVLSSLQKSKICKMILPEEMDTFAQYSLGINILDFSQIFTKNGSHAMVKVLFYIKDKKGNIKAQKLFDEVAKCKSDDAKGAVDALNKASKKLDLELVKWLANAIGN